jgi:YfiH family protein
MGTETASPSWISATWGAPAWIRAGVTTRTGGFSKAPYDELNLASHVGDDASLVAKNRHYLQCLLRLKTDPVWLNQVHGNRIINADAIESLDADGAFTDTPGTVCTVMTADCVPVLLCNKSGTRVAAVHVGWKGFCTGVLDNALNVFAEDIPGIHVWIGPHISSRNYEVGDDVRTACLAKDSTLALAFSANNRGRWQADLERMIRHDLEKHGVGQIVSSGYCTFADRSRFYSYRRDGQSGRMATLVWFEYR